jgi:outer membrane protein assembly factor BamA
MIRIITWLVLILIFSFSIKAQTNYSLLIKPTESITDKSSTDIIKQVGYNKTFKSKSERKKELQSFLFKLYDNGYITATFDSISTDSLNQFAFLNTGTIIHWAKIDKRNVDEGILSDVGFRDKLFAGKYFSQNQVRRLEENILKYCENNGYPFASIKLDSIVFNGDRIGAKLSLTKNQLCKIDSVLIKGNANLSDQYLESYLGIKPGDLYNESLVIKITDRLHELPFVNVTQPYKVLFLDKETKILVYIDKKQASQFDGVIGIAPNNSVTTQGGGPTVSRTQITGEAHLRLNNSYGKGELFDLNWQEPQPLTQDLKVQFNYPFIFKTPFGLDLKLSLFKQDTSYLNLDENIGLQYLLKGGNYLKVFYENTSSTIISSVGLENIQALPPYADVSCNHYGLGYKSEKLDYRLNPRSGYSLEANASVGIKTIKKNPKINDTLYAGLQLKSTEYKADYTFDYYFPLSVRTVIDLGIKGGYINAPNLFQNELFRFGGLRTLRGFDEQSIYASNFHIWKVEFRFIMEQNSYLFLFYNQAWYEWKPESATTYYPDLPYGFGVGITFQSKLGIFSVSYALGSQLNNPLSFKTGKISFGLVNYF